MTVYEAILKRRTIRRFQSKPVPYPVLEKMVNAARMAPSAANLQPCEYLVVDDPALVAEVFTTLKWAGYIYPSGDPPEGKRPTAYIIVIFNREKNAQSGAVDAAAAIENMILTALEEGVASCWLGSVSRKELAGILKIPDKYTIESVLALGYPDQESFAEEFTGSVKYWLDEKGNLHVPKRSLKEILHHNTL